MGTNAGHQRTRLSENRTPKTGWTFARRTKRATAVEREADPTRRYSIRLGGVISCSVSTVSGRTPAIISPSVSRGV